MRATGVHIGHLLGRETMAARRPRRGRGVEHRFEVALENQVLVPGDVELGRVAFAIGIHAEVAAAHVPERLGLVLILAAVAPHDGRRSAAPLAQPLDAELAQASRPRSASGTCRSRDRGSRCPDGWWRGTRRAAGSPGRRGDPGGSPVAARAGLKTALRHSDEYRGPGTSAGRRRWRAGRTSRRATRRRGRARTTGTTRRPRRPPSSRARPRRRPPSARPAARTGRTAASARRTRRSETPPRRPRSGCRTAARQTRPPRAATASPRMPDPPRPIGRDGAQAARRGR